MACSTTFTGKPNKFRITLLTRFASSLIFGRYLSDGRFLTARSGNKEAKMKALKTLVLGVALAITTLGCSASTDSDSEAEIGDTAEDTF